MIEITAHKIEVQKLIDHVTDGGAGAIDVFVGTTRDNTSGKGVRKLEFESYEPMAIKEIQSIIDRAKNKWPIKKYAVAHRIGIVEIGQEAVVIAISTPHRKEAFEACQFVIDELKKTVPIWKKETFEDGDVWVAAHP
ncbi:MAG: molybdenum cofactor biosynthesis protein MoaE [Reichenbachiella sp.]